MAALSISLSLAVCRHVLCSAMLGSRKGGFGISVTTPSAFRKKRLGLWCFRFRVPA